MKNTCTALFPLLFLGIFMWGAACDSFHLGASLAYLGGFILGFLTIQSGLVAAGWYD